MHDAKATRRHSDGETFRVSRVVQYICVQSDRSAGAFDLVLSRARPKIPENIEKGKEEKKKKFAKGRDAGRESTLRSSCDVPQ